LACVLCAQNSVCAACDAVRPLITKSGSSKWIRAVHLLGNNEGSYLVRHTQAAMDDSNIAASELVVLTSYLSVCVHR
jgi:hypothetical protein